jgi:hypothetical protein
MSPELEHDRSGKTGTAMPCPYWRFLRLRQSVRGNGSVQPSTQVRHSTANKADAHW